MSASSVLSTRSTGWKIDVRLASLMDSIFAISFGLGLRFVVDAVSDHDFKITGTIVGLWEGVIMLHFTKKMPKSSDPFIAYAVRLFVDFLCTESITRLVLVLVWTALGMVLADVTPGIWYEVGLRRIWRRFRRDIYTISRMIPTVAFFPPTRTVRFSPSREPSTITDADADADAVPPPSVITTEQTPTTNTVPTTTAPAVRDILRRRVPGYFPADFSDTETELGSVRAGPSPRERTSRRLSVFPRVHDFDESVSSQNDLDEGNLSSVSSTSTERPGVSSTVIDASTIPDMYTEEALVDVVAAPVKEEEEVKTPKQSAAPYMPPTPSDSAMYLYRHPPSEDPLVVRPPSEFMPQIPDFLDEGNTEDWEKIQHQEATEGKPPTPPAKDPAYQLKVPIIPVPVPPQPQLQRSTPSPEDEAKEWDMMDSQFISNPNDNPNATSNDQQGQTHDIDDDDDMYGDEAPDYRTFPAMGESGSAELPPLHTTDFTSGILEPDPVRMDPWASLEKKRMDEEAERRQRESEEAARKQQEEEDALKEKQEEEARQLEEQKLKEKKAQEKAERLKKEAEDDAIRKKKREEDEAAEQKRKEEEEAAERKRKEEEEVAERQRKEEAEERRKQEAARQKKEEERQKKEEEKQRKEEEEKRRKEEERQRKEEEKRRKEEEKQRKEEEKQRKEEEEKRRKEEERQRKDEEKQRKKEEEEQKKREEAERKKVEEEEKEKEEAKKLAEAAEAKRLKEEKEEAEALVAAAAVAQAIAEEEPEAQRLKQEQEENARLILEKEKQIIEQEESQQKAEEAIPPSESVLPNSADQDPEEALPPLPRPIEPEADAETVVSAASDSPPIEVSDRLDRMLLLRAQMVQTEGRLQGLSPNSDQEIKKTEKILRKMRRQAEGRYEAGTSLAQYMNDFDEEDTVSLEGMPLEQKIEEKLEGLLFPEASSLFVKIVVGKKETKKQKSNVIMLLDKYNLTSYTTENKKTFTVKVPEEKFADWLTGYRILSARREEHDGEPESFWG